MSNPDNQEVAEAQMGDASSNKEIVSKLMQDPQMLAALQYNLNKYVGASSGYIAVSTSFRN